MSFDPRIEKSALCNVSELENNYLPDIAEQASDKLEQALGLCEILSDSLTFKASQKINSSDEKKYISAMRLIIDTLKDVKFFVCTKDLEKD